MQSNKASPTSATTGDRARNYASRQTDEQQGPSYVYSIGEAVGGTHYQGDDDERPLISEKCSKEALAFQGPQSRQACITFSINPKCIRDRVAYS